MSKKILFIDSGVGAVSILNEVRRLDKYLDCLVLIDNKNAPFGNKNNDTLNRTCYQNICAVLSVYDVGLIVLACNTLTVSSIKYLRERLHLPIVGTEPNIKVDAKTLALCTEFTANNCTLLRRNKNILSLPMPNLASLIDRNLNNLDKIKPYLKSLLKDYSKYNYIILGCTHYDFVKKQISDVLNTTDINWVENKYGVAKRVMHFVNDSFYSKPRVHILLTKQDKKYRKMIDTFIL